MPSAMAYAVWLLPWTVPSEEISSAVKASRMLVESAA